MKYKTMKQKNKRKGIKIIRIETVGTYTHTQRKCRKCQFSKVDRMPICSHLFQANKSFVPNLAFFHIHSFIHIHFIVSEKVCNITIRTEEIQIQQEQAKAHRAYRRPVPKFNC